MTIAPIMPGVSVGNGWAASLGATAKEREAATPIFTLAGIMRLLNGGDTAIHADARTMASTNPNMRPGSTVMFTMDAPLRQPAATSRGIIANRSVVKDTSVASIQ